MIFESEKWWGNGSESEALGHHLHKIVVALESRRNILPEEHERIEGNASVLEVQAPQTHKRVVVVRGRAVAAAHVSVALRVVGAGNAIQGHIARAGGVHLLVGLAHDFSSPIAHLRVDAVHKGAPVDLCLVPVGLEVCKERPVVSLAERDAQEIQSLDELIETEDRVLLGQIGEEQGEIQGVRRVQVLFNQAKDVLRGRLLGDGGGLGLSLTAGQADRPGVGVSDSLVDVLSHLAALRFVQQDLGLVLGRESHAGNLELSPKERLVVDLIVCQVLRGRHVLKKDRIPSHHTLALTSLSGAGARLHAPYGVVGLAVVDRDFLVARVPAEGHGRER